MGIFVRDGRGLSVTYDEAVVFMEFLGTGILHSWDLARRWRSGLSF